MQLGIIADDFTGASDVANAVNQQGLTTRLAFRECPAVVPQGTEAVVVALKTRSAPVGLAIRDSLSARRGLVSLGCERIYLKICSTFDSTPLGNIGPVAEALADEAQTNWVIVCPAFPAAKRTVFQGHLFVGDRLLSESGMESHPLTPMSDPDLRRWLARQARSQIGHLPHAIVSEGEAAIANMVEAEAAAGRRLVIADATTDDDLASLGAAVRNASLAVGASGLAGGIAAALAGQHTIASQSRWRGVEGPALVLAGSCSGATLSQIATYRRIAPTLWVDPVALCEGRFSADEAIDFLTAHVSEAPLIFSSAAPENVRAAQGMFPAAVIAVRLDSFFSEIARRAVDLGVKRLVVAGGETAGAVTTALGFASFEVGPEVDIGIPALRSEDGRLCLVLKSGNFGDADFFATALDVLAAGATKADR